MSKGGNNIFALVIQFLRVDLQPKHITFGFFEATNTNGQALAINLTELLNIYGLKRKIVVEDEGSNLNIMIAILKSIISCDVLGLEESFQGTCFGHVFLKCANMQQWMNFFAKV
jgi:hypothetical protein